MITVARWLGLAVERLRRAGIDEPRFDAAMLAAKAMGWSRSEVLARPDEPLTASDAAENLLLRRIAREPLAYLLGWREFYGRRFEVGPGVLIPRQETETLVQAAIETAPSGARMADVGAGSGCVGLTLALERPDLHLTLIEKSREAIEYASRNAQYLEAKVEVVHGDALAILPDLVLDLVVTNPPYVGLSDSLQPEVREFEPAEALFAGEDGLDIYRGLASLGCPRILTEIGDGQERQVADVFHAAGWSMGQTWRDLGGTVRVLEAERPRLP